MIVSASATVISTTVEFEKFKNVEFRDLLWEPLTSITVTQVLRLKLRFPRSLGTDITMALGSHRTSTAEDSGRDQGPRHNTDRGTAKHQKVYHSRLQPDNDLTNSPAIAYYI